MRRHGEIFSDPRVTQYLPRGPFKADEALGIARRVIEHFITHWEDHGFGVWAVVEKTSGDLIGQCGLNTLAEAPETEVLYLLDRPYWGRGLATEAARSAVEIGFQAVGLQRIVGLTMPDNVASQRVLTKAGLRYERDATFFGVNVRYFAINRPSQNLNQDG
ncbi:MAG: GNAT family N-acetyltransferase [Candidatus Eremiobacteraeota bacterium]|nr:GNAT family N-acetyltransferase [Candidatus Eremiobacteraeota bacterium]